MSETMLIKDATEATFATDVLQASAERPVVVDFWAAWCGPCRQLSPLLERVASRYAGDVAVVKVDVDRAQSLALQYGIQGIPAVKAFKGGKVVAEFTGLQPEPAVERFFAALVPSPADRLVQQASASDGQAEGLLREALRLQPDHATANIALAERLAARGEIDEARTLLERVPQDERARRLLSELRLAQVRPDEGDLNALRADAEAGKRQVEYGRALAAVGDYEQALEVLVRALRNPDQRESARTTLLEIFTVLGDSHELVRATRPRMAAALFA